MMTLLRFAVFASVGALTLAACSAGTPLTTRGDGGGTTDVVETPAIDGGSNTPIGDGGTSCFDQQPASQGLSQPCCVARGIDACGADLFCAALDGRSQATCYPNHSRENGETCTADVQCTGSHCNASRVCDQGTTTPDSGSPGKCIAMCTTNLQCQSTCPAMSNAISCCDQATSLCYASLAGMCPQ